MKCQQIKTLTTCVSADYLMKMRSFIFFVVSLLGSAVIAPTICPAEEFCCPPFPLPSGLEVGHRWTYLTTSVFDSNHGGSGPPAIESETDTLTVTVDRRHQIGNQTYFELSDGGLYRVDEVGKTWQYDTEAKEERIFWDDLLGLRPRGEDFLDREPGDRVVGYDEYIIEEVVANGYACDLLCLYWVSRYGPFGLDELEWAGGGQINNWTGQNGRNESLWQEMLLDWDVTHVYGFYFGFPENNQYMIIAPYVGVLFYAQWSWDYIFTYTLQLNKKKITVVEDISFGQIKQLLKANADTPLSQ